VTATAREESAAEAERAVVGETADEDSARHSWPLVRRRGIPGRGTAGPHLEGDPPVGEGAFFFVPILARGWPKELPGRVLFQRKADLRHHQGRMDSLLVHDHLFHVDLVGILMGLLGESGGSPACRAR
jgi:hypothetical protein